MKKCQEKPSLLPDIFRGVSGNATASPSSIRNLMKFNKGIKIRGG